MKKSISIAAVLAVVTAVSGAVGAASQGTIQVAKGSVLQVGRVLPSLTNDNKDREGALPDKARVDVQAGASVLLTVHPAGIKGKVPAQVQVDYPYGTDVNNAQKPAHPVSLQSQILLDKPFDTAKVTIHYTRTNFGLNALSAGKGGTAIGADSIALGAESTALGDNARTWFMWMGKDRVVRLKPILSSQATAIGANTLAFGKNSTALGVGASTGVLTTFDGMPIVGTIRKDVEENADAAHPLQAKAYDNGVALGAFSKVRARNSVALGVNSEAVSDNTVAVGNAQDTRRITFVAPGVEAGDAATVGQLREAEQKIYVLQQQIRALQQQVQQLLQKK